MAILLPQHHWLKRLCFPPLNYFGILVKNQLAIDIWGYFWAPSSIQLVCMSVPMPVPHCIGYCSCVESFDNNLAFLWTLNILPCQNAKGDLTPSAAAQYSIMWVNHDILNQPPVDGHQIVSSFFLSYNAALIIQGYTSLCIYVDVAER